MEAEDIYRVFEWPGLDDIFEFDVFDARVFVFQNENIPVGVPHVVIILNHVLADHGHFCWRLHFKSILFLQTKITQLK